MTDNLNARVEIQVADCYSTWAHDYFENFYGDSATYPPVHSDLILKLLLESGSESVLDAGCGPASFLKHIASSSIEWHGFDLTPEMVEEAERVIDQLGRSHSRVWLGSVLDDAAFTSPEPGLIFDSAVLVGVLPHIPVAADVQVLSRMRSAITPGGLLVAEARNALFSLFTFNRPTYEFVLQELIGWDALKVYVALETPEAPKAIEKRLAQLLAMDLPPTRRGKSGEQGYDEILSRTHVPFLLKEAAEDAGWRDVKLKFAHFHSLPPQLATYAPISSREASLQMESPDDWRGLFMASTFLVTGHA